MVIVKLDLNTIDQTMDKIVIFIPVNVIFYVLNHNVEINYQLGKLHSLLGNETNISTRVLNNTRTASLNLITQKVRARFIRSSRVRLL